MSQTAPRRGNRLAIVLSVAALVTSVGIAGGPAFAKALNAHTVDHKHAVGYDSSVKHRKGKLVATSNRTGRLPNNIIAKAPNAAKLAGKPGTKYLLKSEVLHTGGVTSSATLPAVGVTTSQTTFTTTRKGRLLIDLTGSGQLQCPSSSFVSWWIQLDGAPVYSSRMQFGEAVSISFDYNGFPAIHLSGLTEGAVAAGTHTIALVGGCTSGTNGGSASSGIPATATIMVLGKGPAPAPSPKAGPSCVKSDGKRTCH